MCDEIEELNGGWGCKDCTWIKWNYCLVSFIYFPAHMPLWCMWRCGIKTWHQIDQSCICHWQSSWKLWRWFTTGDYRLQGIHPRPSSCSHLINQWWPGMCYHQPPLVQMVLPGDVSKKFIVPVLRARFFVACVLNLYWLSGRMTECGGTGSTMGQTMNVWVRCSCSSTTLWCRVKIPPRYDMITLFYYSNDVLKVFLLKLL